MAATDDVVAYPVTIVKRETVVEYIDDARLRQEFADDVQRMVEYIMNHKDCKRYDLFFKLEKDFKSLTINDFEESTIIFSEVDGGWFATLLLAPEFYLVHIFGFLQSFYGRRLAIQLYFFLKYDDDVHKYLVEKDSHTYKNCKYVRHMQMLATPDRYELGNILRYLNLVRRFDGFKKIVNAAKTFTSEMETNTNAFFDHLDPEKSLKYQDIFNFIGHMFDDTPIGKRMHEASDFSRTRIRLKYQLDESAYIFKTECPKSRQYLKQKFIKLANTFDEPKEEPEKSPKRQRSE
jgi:hypothetical protein